MALQDNMSGHLLLLLERISMDVMVVHAILSSLVLVYHSLETTSSVIVEQRPGTEYPRYILTILSGMDRGVGLIVTAVASTAHRGSVQSSISLPLMTSSYDCVLTSLLMTKTFQLNTLNSMYSTVCNDHDTYT